MAKPKLPNQRKSYLALKGRINQYALILQRIYDALNLEASKLALSTGYEGEREFRWSDYPQTRAGVDNLQSRFVRDIHACIMRGTSREWKESNLMQDLLARKAMAYYESRTSSGNTYKKYFQTNSDALKAFQERAGRGLSLSKVLWNQSAEYKEELEYAISSGIEKGMSAVTLSKRLSKYLNDFPSLKEDYGEKYGKAVKCKDAHYNSMRLARTEINMAYRAAEQKRWEQMDFVVGFEVKLSGSHPRMDICDTLAGRYPKSFSFSGWHPNCFCYCVPILKSEEDFWKDDEEGSANEVKDVTENFKDWVLCNQKRIKSAEEKGTLPYFLRDNSEVVDNILHSQKNNDLEHARSLGGGLKAQTERMMALASSMRDKVQGCAEEIAARHGAYCTPINLKSAESIMRKCRKEGCSPFILKDTVRTTIIVPKGEIEAVLQELQAQPTFWRLKRQGGPAFFGYSGNIINMNMPNGLVAEIQVNTPEMIYAKETAAKAILGEKEFERIAKKYGLPSGKGHEYYEKIRDPKGLSDAELEKLVKESDEYYSHFR